MERMTAPFRWFVDVGTSPGPGGLHLLRAEASIPLDRLEVFPFFAAAENLERITPPELRFRILSPLPILMAEGAVIEYRLSLEGVPFRWRTRITEWDPPRAFTDLQEKGPYRTWIHRHTFEESAGGTLMRDEVRWSLPLWPWSAPVLPWVRRKLERIFRFRQEVIGRLLLGEGETRGGTRTD